MTFLHWICRTYLARRPEPRLSTVKQYWRDFKMLYRRSNKGEEIKPDDSDEIRKVNSSEKIL